MPLDHRVFPFIAYFLRPYRWYVALGILLMVISGLHGVVHSFLLKTIIDALIVTSNDAIFKVVFWPVLFFIVIYEMHNLTWRGMDYIRLKTEPHIRSTILSDIFSFVHRHSYQYFQDSFSGTISSNIHALVDGVEIILYQTIMHAMRGCVLLIGSLIAMYLVHPLFFICLLVWVMGFTTVSLFYSKKIKFLSDAYAESQSEVSGQVVDSITNASTVRLFSARTYEVSYLSQWLQKMRSAFQKKESFLVKFYLFQGLSVTALISILIFLLIYLKQMDRVSIGDFALILTLIITVTDHAWWLTEQIDRLNEAAGKCRQSLRALLTPLEIEDQVSAKPLSVTKGEIVFEDVQFFYNDQEPLFQNKSVVIHAGEKVGLVGYSGGGKTTFVHLILRLHEVNQGRILIDGQDIKAVTQDSLRSAIAMIPQDPLLFHRTLMDNIRYGRENASDQEVLEASKKAHADEFISALSKGYETLVGERGVKLSGGQRQRVAIARAILKNAPILILDEATSQLDSLTERNIQESLYQLMERKTTIVIAHRLSTLLKMDRILVFDQGKIIEEGAHAELIAREGLYAKLWKTQVGGFLQDE